jgi:hypothetical protein
VGVRGRNAEGRVPALHGLSAQGPRQARRRREDPDAGHALSRRGPRRPRRLSGLWSPARCGAGRTLGALVVQGLGRAHAHDEEGRRGCARPGASPRRGRARPDPAIGHARRDRRAVVQAHGRRRSAAGPATALVREARAPALPVADRRHRGAHAETRARPGLPRPLRRGAGAPDDRATSGEHQLAVHLRRARRRHRDQPGAGDHGPDAEGGQAACPDGGAARDHRGRPGHDVGDPGAHRRDLGCPPG